MKGNVIVIILLLSGWALQAQDIPGITGSKVLKEDAQAALDFHNKIRSDVGSPPLKWSTELAAYAQRWADHLAVNCQMDHRPQSGPWAQKHGENIFLGGGFDFTALDASESWYSEIRDYTYRPLSGRHLNKTGHYTQMVWKSTSHMGIGMAICKKGAVLIVANYSPPGNYIGEKPY